MFNLKWFQPEVKEKEPVKPKTSFFSTDIQAPISKNFLPQFNAKVFEKTVLDTRVYNPDTGKQYSSFAQDSANDYQGSLKQIFSVGTVGIPEAQANWYASHSFIGYQMCGLLAQNWLINKCCEVPARDAVRKGYKITTNGADGVKPEVLAAIHKENKRFGLNAKLVEFVKMGRVFGIRVAMFKVENEDTDYYVKPFNLDAIKQGTYKGFVQIDPYWCMPELTSAGASDPSNAIFYEPAYWIINGKRVHKSHLVIFKGPEVIDIFKPAYLYGGLSVPQMIYERVYAAERTANEAPQLAASKRQTVFYTDTGKALANQAEFEQKMGVWAHYRDNFGIKVADLDSDKIEQHDTALSDLDALIMTQYQIVAAAANIPATKLLGTVPKGFNSSGDYEEASYHEEVETIQTTDLEPLIERHIQCLMRSQISPKFNVKPFDFDITWEPLQTISAVDIATVNKTKAETDAVYVAMGAINAQEARERLAADEFGGHNTLDLNQPNLDDVEDN